MATINPERVLSDLRTLATFGAYKAGYIARRSLPKTSLHENGS